MRIDKIRTLSGPNIYNYKPVLLMKLYLEELTDTESCDVAGFNERLVARLPGLKEHQCSKGRAGGFVERLEAGTYFGHIIEHVALELSEAAGVPVYYGKTLYADEPGCYNVVVAYKAERGMRYLLEVAVELVGALVNDDPYPLKEKIEEARRLIARTELGPSTRAIVDAARRRGIPHFRVNRDSLVQLGYGKNRRFIQAAMTSETGGIAVEIAGDKELTKSILEQADIPVPRGLVVETPEEAAAALHELSAPIVVKPLDGHQGNGVSLNLSTESEVMEAFRIAQVFGREVLVEEMYAGRDYRVLVVGGKLVAASERIPCHVVGDGAHTLRELIDIANLDPRRGEGHDNVLTKIKVDEVMLACLHKSGLRLEQVPGAGERVFLRETGNLSTGGTAVDVTDIVHPEVRRVCERAARVVGLDICGLDLIATDIAQPLQPGNGFIEANAAPGLRMHTAPTHGQPRDVGGAIVDMLYPPGAEARIPIISITGTNGKTTVTRMIGHILQEMRWSVGMTTTDGIHIGGELVARGDTTGPHSARVVLSDPTVEVAVLETARGGITRRGLGYDWSDISIITNIREDHIGQDGIRDIEDLVHIKSLVAERVREGGTLILNADDEQSVRLIENSRVRRTDKQFIYFSLNDNNLLVRKYADIGGGAFFVRDGQIIEAAGHVEYEVATVADIPVTMGGTARFQVSNVLAAVAACRAHGVTRENIAAALKTFDNAEHNPGRANLYQVGAGYVMVDYGHNPDAFDAVSRMAALWHGRRVTAILGVPGDRDDSLIEESGRIAARGFHRIIIKEDKDLRGRRKGEVAGLLCRTVNAESPGRECLTVLDEVEAFSDELREMKQGDVVVVFYDKLEPVLEVLAQHGAVPVTSIGEFAPQLSVATI
ncbi:MAG TPA: cyanophycin synthetase [Pyrinomonadaceae bacterium]|jgi:cyanophycin synthetase|nr:cyanophycin synthetase [Pyrinomonadaceae bacterium]